jgi:putative effector of murein hydrolase
MAVSTDPGGADPTKSIVSSIAMEVSAKFGGITQPPVFKASAAVSSS